MKKQDCEHLNKMFDEVEFIERIERLRNNAKGPLIMSLTLPSCVKVNSQRDAKMPIYLPKELSEYVVSSLINYKDILNDILEGLTIVDQSISEEEAED